MEDDGLMDTVANSVISDQAWETLVSTHNPYLIRHTLTMLRADIRIQRDRRKAWLQEGTWTDDEYHAWSKKVARFSGSVNTRLTQIEQIARQRPDETTKNYYRRRHAEDTSVIAALTRAIDAYLEDENMSASILEEALDILRNFGPEHGDMTLIAALDAGLFDNSKSPRRDTGANMEVANLPESV
jgi:tryptophan 2,3-dioxygenase